MDHIGRFEILQRLGEGGMGEVYLARDPKLDRKVAIKTILNGQTFSPGMRERFQREAQAAGAMSHPNLVTIHEFGEDGPLRYLVMEYLPGQDLRTFLTNRSLSPFELLEVLAQVCDGLAYAHEHEVLHRDIKPSNIRVWRESGRMRAKVMDFGLARIPGSDLTVTGAVVGTMGYLAPESLNGGAVDARSDTYAVGVILYEALTGHRPVLTPVVPGSGTRPPASRAIPLEAMRGISPRTWNIALKAIDVDPARRFQTAAAFSKALRQAQTGEFGEELSFETLASSDFLPAGSSPSVQARPARSLPWIMAPALVAGGAALFWAATRSPRPQEPRPAEPTSAQPFRQSPPRQAPPAAPEDGSFDAEREFQGLLDLYREGRYTELPEAFGRAQARGLSPQQLRRLPAFRAFMEEERQNRRIPAEVRDRLDPFLPRPPAARRFSKEP